MSEADGTIPTTVTRKRKRGSGFRYSTKRVLELGSVRKALTYPCELLSEIGY
jgi:hypothetical protein